MKIINPFERTGFVPVSTWRFFAAWLAATGPAAAAVQGSVPITENGRPVAVVVIPDDAYPVAEYAAGELVRHIEKASGAALQVVRESTIPPQPGPRIYVGATQAAAAAGIEASRLPSEQAVLRTRAGVLFIAGRDGEGHPLDEFNPHSGTLWGVYEFLERELGVRWLWPGPLGTYVPERRTITVEAMDDVITPAFRRRKIRQAGIRRSGEYRPSMGFNDEGREPFFRAQQVFFRRHRMGKTGGFFDPVGDAEYVHEPFAEWAVRHAGMGRARGVYMHAFEQWWDVYGKTHPDFFQRIDGRRGARPNNLTSMCVSNPALHDQILALWKAGREAAEPIPELPGTAPNRLNLCENDEFGLCECDACRAWDGPQPGPGEIPAAYRGAFQPWNTSDRYARFLAEMHRRASEIEPDVRVFFYAYKNYFVAPSPGIELNPNIVIGFVPYRLRNGWFPRDEETQAWIKAQWRGWAERGASLFYRPNWFLTGYAMPHIFARQHADLFQFAARNNMIATDYDSLTGQWSAQGTNLYSLLRLHTRPEQPIDEILDEYYSAFGPAADDVRRYFDYWEDYSHDLFVNRNIAVPLYSTEYFRDTFRLFPLEVFAPANEMLESAAAAAAVADNPEYAQRVRFLQLGLEHAFMGARLSALCGSHAYYLSEHARLGGACPRQALVRELVRFRAERQKEGLFVANFDWCAARELHILRRAPEILSARLDRPLAVVPHRPAGPEEAPAPLWVRRNSLYLVHAHEGERVELEIEAHGIRDRLTYRIATPDGAVITEGQVDVRASEPVAFDALETGVYTVEVFPDENAGRIRTKTPLSVLLMSAQAQSGQVNLKSPEGDIYFWVPAGVEQFDIRVAGEGWGETVQAALYAPGDVLIEEKDRISGSAPHVFSAERNEAAQGEIWRLRFDKASGDTHHGDVFLAFPKSIPPVFSFHPDALLVPWVPSGDSNRLDTESRPSFALPDPGLTNRNATR